MKMLITLILLMSLSACMAPPMYGGYYYTPAPMNNDFHRFETERKLQRIEQLQRIENLKGY